MSNHSEFDRAKQLRRQMSRIRQNLDDDLEQVEKSARTLMNWQYYTDNYPWVCLGVAAALGYIAVPRKLEIQAPDPKTLEKLAKKRHLVVEQRPKAEAKGGLVGAAFSFMSGLVLKTVMAQVGQQLASAFDSRSAPSRSDQAQYPPSTVSSFRNGDSA